MIIYPPRCTVCGESTIHTMAIGDKQVYRCAEHGSEPYQIRSQADIDHIAALEAERDKYRAEVHRHTCQLLDEINTQPRPAIMAFARLMEAKLATKDATKGDWRRERDSALWAISAEWNELYHEALQVEPIDRQAVVWEACDVALWAMICADRHIPLCDHDGRGRDPRPAEPSSPVTQSKE